MNDKDRIIMFIKNRIHQIEALVALGGDFRDSELKAYDEGCLDEANKLLAIVKERL